jgi:predicted permease
MNFAIRLYRRLARAFPHEFKIVYGADVIQLGEDVVKDIAKQNGFLGLARLIADLAIRIPIEYLTEMRRDLMYALRTLAASPGFAAVGVISLGLGIGVTTLIYSEINALILRDLPLVPEPDRLVMTQAPVSYPYYEEYRKQQNLFTSAAAFVQTVPFAMILDQNRAKSERVFGHLVSPEYFSVLSIPAARGRVFSPENDKPGGAPIVVVSDRFWKDRLNSDPNAIGRTIRLNGQTTTIVGIAPKDFLGVMPILPADLFVPTTVPPKTAPELADDILHKRDTKAFSIIARLAPGVTLDTAEAALDTITRHLDESSLDPDRDRKGRRIRLLPGGGIMPVPPEMRPVFWGLWGTLMSLILGIACMNLATMLLARAGARRREIAIRLAVGASRFRLIRQLLTESILLAVFGGLAGLALTYWLANLISTMRFPGSIPFEMDIRPDWRVMIFTFLLSIIVGIGFGLAPALAATKADVAPTLKEGGVAQVRGYRRFGLRNLLVVWQVAGSLMLLMMTGFMVIGYSNMATANATFDMRTLYLLAIDPVRDGYSPDQVAAFFDKLPERLRNLSAVQEVALATAAPFSTELGAKDFTTTPASGGSAKTLRSAAQQAIGRSYFAAISEPMLAGREFTERDQRAESATTIPVILNQTAAKELFGNDDPIGRHIDQRPQSFEVIGVVRDLKGPGMSAGTGTTATLYLPLTRKNLAHPPPGGLTLMVRATAGSDALEAIRREIAGIDPNVTIFNIRTLAQSLDDMNAYIRLGSVFYGGMGVFGLILASVGLAGVTAYAVTQRRKEIGIRMALGARKGQVLRLVMREGAALVLIGSVLGFGGSVVLARAMSSILSVFAQIFQNKTNDMRLILGAPLLLAGLAMIACYLPARRSTQIDPLKALREE